MLEKVSAVLNTIPITLPQFPNITHIQKSTQKKGGEHLWLEMLRAADESLKLETALSSSMHQ